MINDVLDFSRLEAGPRGLPSQPFDMARALADVMRSLMPLARRRDLVMMFDWEGDATWVQGNESAIRQIATNLLGNAIKFTEVGHVALHTLAQPDGPGRVSLAVQVADTGPGISPELRQRVFDAFEQGDDSLARRHGGTGLGLTIARSLADALGGSLHLACPAEGGCQFTLRLSLPLAVPASPVASTPALAPAPASRQVWLVYHRQAPGDWLARRLARQGWQVSVRVGLDAALALCRQADQPRPDLVLLGEPVLQPGVDLAALRRALPQVPMRLLIRPDWHDPDMESLARSQDMPLVIAPLTPDDLRSLGDASPVPAAAGDATDATGGSPGPADPGLAAARAVARPFAHDPALPPAAPTPLRPGAEVLLVEDNAVNQIVGEAYLQALGLRVRLADDGPAALAACLERAPALVLMDLQMPGMDGLEAAARLLALQRQGRWPGAPIVALTAHAGDADRDACLAAGMSGVMTKPFTIDGLQRQLAPWLAA